MEERVNYFRNFRLFGHLHHYGGAGRRMRREERNELLCYLALAALFASALGLVRHWRPLLRNLFLCCLSRSPPRYGNDVTVRRSYLGLVYDGRQRALELRILSCSEFVS